VRAALGVDLVEHDVDGLANGIGGVGQYLPDALFVAELGAELVQRPDRDGAAMRLAVVGTAGHLRSPPEVLARGE
jgi:hypothetical protein